MADYLLVLGDARRRLGGIGFMLLVLAALDLLGVGLVAPFAQVLATGEGLPEYSLVSNDPRLAFVLLGLALVVVFMVKAVLGYVLNRSIAGFSAGYRAELIRRLVAAYQGQTWQFHLEHNSAELINRVLWYTDMYSLGTLTASLQFVTNGAVALALFVLLAISDILSVTILVVFLGTVFLVTHRIVRSRLKEASVQNAKYNERLVRGTKEALEGFREVRVLGAEEHFLNEISSAARGVAKTTARRSALGTVPRYAFEVAVVTILVVIGTTAASLEGSPTSAVPVLGMFAAAAIRLIPASTALLNSVNQLRSSRFVLGKLACELRSVAALAPHTEAVPGSQSKPFDSLRLTSVTFGYPDAAPVLRGVDLEIHAGEAIGLMGPSGAGKSTLAEVILGFLMPQSGEVCVDGKGIHGDLRSWLKRATYIPQKVLLLDDTLRRNIDFGLAHENGDDERIATAIEQAQLADVVADLPHGLDTILGEGGVRLSGGQRQRVALARALYHGRDFIILDEATSALDRETEDAVVRAVMGLAGQKTLLVIAHRESTLAGCTKRFVLRDGRLHPLEGSFPRTRTASGDFS